MTFHRLSHTNRFSKGIFGIGLSLVLLGCTAVAPDAVAEGDRLSMDPVSPLPVAEPSPSPDLGQYLPISAQVEVGSVLLQLEVADTPQQKALGLMYRPPLPDDRGMLFPFDPPRSVQFWMRNVPVPLDMVFLQNGRVEAIVSAAPPCTTPTCPVYGPTTVIDQVIELRAGRAEELGLQVGDQLTIEFLTPEEMRSSQVLN